MSEGDLKMTGIKLYGNGKSGEINNGYGNYRINTNGSVDVLNGDPSSVAKRVAKSSFHKFAGISKKLGLASANRETRTRVARLGGRASKSRSVIKRKSKPVKLGLKYAKTRLNQEGVYPDSISIKNGIITARKGFYYRFNKTSEDWRGIIANALPEANIIDSGEKWVPFRGGASIANQSHWYVKFEFFQETE